MNGFYFITHENHDPYFNIASEEYLLKKKSGSFIYVWKNAPAVIVGVNQNALQEVNLGECEKRDVKIVRRLTGGGAVYHDLNNLCYTVITETEKDEDLFKKFTAPVIEYLNGIGVKAEFSGRNDITVEGKKISGNAETFYKDRVMHHGTILFKTDMDALSSVLKPNRFKTESKGIKSVRARVTNVSEYTNIPLSEFTAGLIGFLSKNALIYDFTEEDLREIEKLKAEKYSLYEWNLGSSPKGKNAFTEKFPFGVFELYFDTEGGKLKNVDIKGDFFSKKDLGEFVKTLDGVKFDKKDIASAFLRISNYISGADGREIAEKLFS